MNKVDPKLVKKLPELKAKNTEKERPKNDKNELKVDEDYLPAMYMLLF